jgi:multidrug efflux pump subunit AcrB
VGDDYDKLIVLADQIVKKFRGIPGLADVQTNFDGGKPEFQAKLDPGRMRELGVLGIDAGMELRTQVEGTVAAKFRDNGQEYDIRVRLQDDQRDLEKEFPRVWVPNQNHNLVRLADIATPLKTEGPSTINRQNRARYIQVSGQLGFGGALGNIQAEAERIMKDVVLPPGVHYEFVGQSEDMKDLITSMITAVCLAILFTFMILASLYESPIIPLSILPAIPMSVVGAFFALFITHRTLDIFSMIAIVMLFGLVTKNSILLVDYILQGLARGLSRDDAIREAGRIRLRPILMTTLALVAGMMPLALALSEVGKFRQSMGVAVVGGLVSSFFLTLLIVPAVYSIVDDFRLWLRWMFRLDAPKES